MKILNAQTRNFYSELDKLISRRNKIDIKTLKTVEKINKWVLAEQRVR